MRDSILAFFGGSITNYACYILGYINVQNLLEVFLLGIVGGLAGCIGKWIWKKVLNLTKEK